MTDETSISVPHLGENEKGKIPRVLDYETQIVVPGELDSFLDVVRRSGIDADDWHAPLLTRKAEGGVEVAGLDRAVGKNICLPVGVLGGPRLVRSPHAVEPASADVGAVTRGRVVARSGWRDGMDQRLRDF